MRVAVVATILLLLAPLVLAEDRLPVTAVGRAITDNRSMHDHIAQRYSSPYFDAEDRLFWETWYEVADARNDVDAASRIETLYLRCTSAHLYDAYARTNTTRGADIKAICAAHETQAAEYWSQMTGDVAGVLRAALHGDLSEFREALARRTWIPANVREHLIGDAEHLERRIRKEGARGR